VLLSAHAIIHNSHEETHLGYKISTGKNENV